jgi:hypothetical protein
MVHALPPDLPTNREARVATVMATRQTADLFDGKLRVSKRCPVKGEARVCMAKIIGPEPLRLRVRVRANAMGDSWIVSARIVD